MIREKLQRNNGESLAEVLISILIIAVALVLLSSLILAATRLMDKGDNKIQTIYEGGNNIAEGKATLVQRGDEINVVSKKYPGKGISIKVDTYEDDNSHLKAYNLNE